LLLIKYTPKSDPAVIKKAVMEAELNVVKRLFESCPDAKAIFPLNTVTKAIKAIINKDFSTVIIPNI